MALVTLQRSPTPSAASTSSTATTNAGEVSGNKHGEMRCDDVMINKNTTGPIYISHVGPMLIQLRLES